MTISFAQETKKKNHFVDKSPLCRTPKKAAKVERKNGYKQDNKKNKLDKHSFCKIAIIRASLDAVFVA